ncbi:unnamed protein product [Withania somnifera]
MSYIVGKHLINLRGCILCCFCETRVAFVEDYVPDAQDLVYGGSDVVVANNVNYHLKRDGNTLTNIYCIQCRVLLRWELIAVTQPSNYFIVGRFFMRLNQLMYQSGVTLHVSLFGGANEHAPDDQEGGANGQNHDQDVGADDHNADQDGGASDQVGGANEQDRDANNEQNADQDEDDNEQNHDQDGGSNELDHDEDRDTPMKRRRM